MTRRGERHAIAVAAMGLAGVAAITAIVVLGGTSIGVAAAALFYLLPVLFVSTQAGVFAGSATATAAALAYDYFVLPPRFTLAVNGWDNIVAFAALVAVAVVTSQLASSLHAREAEALDRARDSDEQAALMIRLARVHELAEVDRGALAFLTDRFGDARMIDAASIADGTSGLAPLDASAAAWALHNGDLTGAASNVMPSADYRFVPLSRDADAVLAIAAADTRPGDGDQALALARIWAQARDRLALAGERAARDRLEERDALRRTLLAALAHDFRTPLTVLKAGLANHDAPEDLAEQVERIERMSIDLITAARIESGDLRPQFEPIDLVDIVAPLPELIGREDVTVETTLPADLPLVAADPVLLRHMLLNLLDNAIRHAGSQVRIAATAESGAVIVSVEDDGPGLPAGGESAIFERFVAMRGDDRTGGSGLGLSIVRGLGEAMGVTVAAGTAESGGARFTLGIPLYRRAGA